MFVTNTRSGYTRSGEQVASGLFLILMVTDGDAKDVRGIVRKVSYHQCGQFMMGRVRIAGESLTLSGAYGADGLTKDVPLAVWAKGTPLPPELYETWAKGDGWNSSGSEGPAMLAWAKGLVAAAEKAKERKPYREPTGPMNAKAASHYMNNLRGEAAGFARRAIAEQWSFEEMLKRWHDGVCGGPRWKRAPQRVHSYMRGWFDCFMNDLYQRHVEWRLWLDGKHVRSKEVPEARWNEVDGDKGAHVWAKTGKVWSGFDPNASTEVAQA